jgi:hypothetical protein
VVVAVAVWGVIPVVDGRREMVHDGSVAEVDVAASHDGVMRRRDVKVNLCSMVNDIEISY